MSAATRAALDFDEAPPSIGMPPAHPPPQSVAVEPTFIGVDPGGSGGVSILDTHGRNPRAWKMPDTERDVWLLFHALKRENPGAVALIEQVHGGAFGRFGRDKREKKKPCPVCHRSDEPKQGVVSAFTFGQNYGGLRMALHAAEIPFDELVPRSWQKVAGLVYPAGTETRTDRKNASKSHAQQLFPGVKMTHAIADPILLALACRRVYLGGGLRRG